MPLTLLPEVAWQAPRRSPARAERHYLHQSQWRWSEKGVFAQILMGLATEELEEKTVMIDATYLKTHRAASSLRVKKEGVDAWSGEPRAA